MIDDQLEGDRDIQAPAGVRAAFKVLGILAAIGLVAVALLLFGVMRQAHDFRQDAQSNKSVATAQASASAQAFYRDLVAAAKTAVPTRSQVQALSERDRIGASPPLVEDGSVVVMIAALKGYTIPQYFEGGDGAVQLCYRAALPIAPAATPAATLRQIACAPSTDGT
jgi:hypothetical protein